MHRNDLVVCNEILSGQEDIVSSAREKQAAKKRKKPAAEKHDQVRLREAESVGEMPEVESVDSGSDVELVVVEQEEIASEVEKVDEEVDGSISGCLPTYM